VVHKIYFGVTQEKEVNTSGVRKKPKENTEIKPLTIGTQSTLTLMKATTE